MTVAELHEFIRFFLGNIGTDIISNESLDKIIQQVLDSGIATTPCQEKYYTTKAVLEWLIRGQAVSSSSGGGGALKKRTEKDHNIEISEEYDTTAATTRATWDSVLENLLADPDSIGCTVFPDSGGDSTKTGQVIIGGATENGYASAFKGRDKFGTAIYNRRTSGYRRMF